MGKNSLQLEDYKILVDRIKHYGYGLKINTVVTSYNFNEKLNDFIRYAEPKRWKILQVLPIVGQNDGNIGKYEISEAQFQLFIDNHLDLQGITKIVTESNSQVKGSYVMVDPAGRFFDNVKGTHNYSRNILEVGVAK